MCLELTLIHEFQMKLRGWLLRESHIRPLRNALRQNACNGAGGRLGFEINASRARPLMRDVLPSESNMLTKLSHATNRLVDLIYMRDSRPKPPLDIGTAYLKCDSVEEWVIGKNSSWIYSRTR